VVRALEVQFEAELESLRPEVRVQEGEGRTNVPGEGRQAEGRNLIDVDGAINLIYGLPDVPRTELFTSPIASAPDSDQARSVSSVRCFFMGEYAQRSSVLSTERHKSIRATC
jgi:hypothetical protein